MQSHLIQSYLEINEESRLQSTLARRVEYLTTIEAIQPFWTNGSTILDIGCGTGIYSIYLAKQGIKVTAVDLVSKHIDRLLEMVTEQELDITAFVGNAVDLSALHEETFDLVLCLGPMYHLIEEWEHERCINECIRVTKNNGVIAFAYISPFSVFPCVIRGDHRKISKKLAEKIIQQRKISAEDSFCFWTDNYYYAPQEIEIRLRKHNLRIEDHLGTDGQSIAFQSTINSMSDQEFQVWMDYHRMVCREPSMIGGSNHGLIIARKM